jgi:hypothetical protein
MIKVFLSYSHEDEELRTELYKHLGALRHEKIIDAWWDHQIPVGSNWSEEISRQLEVADLILLLVSPSFLNSPYCYVEEMRRAIERHDSGQAIVVPILLRTCYWQPAPFAKIQGLPKGMIPVTNVPHKKRDQVWSEVAEGIHQAAIACNARTGTGATKSDNRGVSDPSITRKSDVHGPLHQVADRDQDDRSMLRAILTTMKDEIDYYLRQVDMWVRETNEEARRSSRPNFPDRFHYLSAYFPNRVAEDLELLSSQNDFRTTIREVRTSVESLTAALSEFNDLRWITTIGPQIEMLYKYFKDAGDFKELWSDVNPAEEEAQRRHRIALLGRVKEYGAKTMSELLANDRYNSDLDKYVRAILSNCEILDEAVTRATTLARRYELLLLGHRRKTDS